MVRRHARARTQGSATQRLVLVTDGVGSRFRQCVLRWERLNPETTPNPVAHQFSDGLPVRGVVGSKRGFGADLGGRISCRAAASFVARAGDFAFLSNSSIIMRINILPRRVGRERESKLSIVSP